MTGVSPPPWPSETRDNANWNCCLVPAGLNQPVTDHSKDLAWGYSDWDFRHKAVVFGSLPSLLGVRISGSYVAQSGTPFSLVVNEDINGDGSANNDLAFVFDPADPSTPPEIAEAMQRVLDNPDPATQRFNYAVNENVGVTRTTGNP